MKYEISMIEKNETWELVDIPRDNQWVEFGWVSAQKIKARRVANGYSQNPRIDFNETFAPMASLGNIKMLIALIAQKG